LVNSTPAASRAPFARSRNSSEQPPLSRQDGLPDREVRT
jgi:hypothetical protein